jgi:hypothetical protein
MTNIRLRAKCFGATSFAVVNWLAEPELLAQLRAKAGASGRTRTDEYKFTKLVLWLLRHRGKWRSHVDSHHEPSPSQGDVQISYTLRANDFEKMVSVAGLSPARLCLKCRVLEMLCIDGEGGSKSVSQ